MRNKYDDLNFFFIYFQPVIKVSFFITYYRRFILIKILVMKISALRISCLIFQADMMTDSVIPYTKKRASLLSVKPSL